VKVLHRGVGLNKRPGGKLRPSQIKTLGELWESNAIVVVAYPLQDVLEAIEPYLEVLRWEPLKRVA
jgi:hypothetical protein